MTPPRLRMFAGPNGSGKSTIKTVLPPALLGVYINPDEIQAVLEQDGRLDLGVYDVHASAAEIEGYLRQSPVLSKDAAGNLCDQMEFLDNAIRLSAAKAGSYLASALSAFLRTKLVDKRATFTFETVMSSVDKVEFLCKAQQAGYRTYLYFIATNDPEINISRVQLRESLGGHSVPPEKIVSRYHRSLSLLLDAIRCSNRAYLFDNSGDAPEWIAEVTEGKDLELKTAALPEWFVEAVIQKLSEAI